MVNWGFAQPLYKGSPRFNGMVVYPLNIVKFFQWFRLKKGYHLVTGKK
jgi:hypothetical protein